MELNSRVSSEKSESKENMDYSSHYPSLYLFEKRAFDIIISSIALIILSPLFLIILLLNIFSKDNQGPLFYRQERMGLHGKKFKMYKFRSMVVNAEEKLYENPELYSAYVANSFKLEPSDDPRITKLGLFLRKTSIDEIPQFINIIKGDMTLIGPRPVIEQELIEYDVSKLLSVKPGAMGLWQASGRSDIGYPERANIEMQYIDEACLKVDFKIFCKNILKVLSRKGAY